MAEFKAVFFDLDGTLWDKAGCSDEVMEIVLPKLTPYLPEQEPEEIILHFNAALLDMVRESGLKAPHQFSCTTRFERLLKGFGIQKEGLASELSATYNAARRLAMRSFVRDGVHWVLGRLGERGLQLGIIANGSSALQRHTVQALGLEPFLQHLVIGEVEGYNKPDPRLFWRALELAGVEGREMLYVGDSLITDVLGASRAGVPVAWLHTDEQTLPPGFPAPDYCIQDLREVVGLVED
jgi:putative hydrolase of the HAD superfamily